MNRQTTALIFILSLLAVFITNGSADDGVTVDPNNVPSAEDQAAGKSTGGASEAAPTVPPATQDETVGPVAGGDAAESTTVGSGVTFSALGAVATTILANFF